MIERLTVSLRVVPLTRWSGETITLELLSLIGIVIVCRLVREQMVSLDLLVLLRYCVQSRTETYSCVVGLGYFLYCKDLKTTILCMCKKETVRSDW